MSALCQIMGYPLEMQGKYNEILILSDYSLWHGIENLGWESNKERGIK